MKTIMKWWMKSRKEAIMVILKHFRSNTTFDRIKVPPSTYIHLVTTFPKFLREFVTILRGGSFVWCELYSENIRLLKNGITEAPPLTPPYKLATLHMHKWMTRTCKKCDKACKSKTGLHKIQQWDAFKGVQRNLLFFLHCIHSFYSRFVRRLKLWCTIDHANTAWVQYFLPALGKLDVDYAYFGI